MVETNFLATEEFKKVATMIQTIIFKHSDKSEELTNFIKRQGIKFLVINWWDPLIAHEFHAFINFVTQTFQLSRWRVIMRLQLLRLVKNKFRHIWKARLN